MLSVLVTPSFLLFPLLSLILFKTMRFEHALVISLMTGYLFLPPNVGVNLPGLPPLEKNSSISLALLLGWLVARPRDVETTKSDSFANVVFLTFLVTLLIAPFVTVATNGEALRGAGPFRPGLGLRDAVSMLTEAAILLPPFFLARRYLATPEAQRQMLMILVVFALGYSLLVLFERRMSPQLNNWVWGFFPHSWQQHIRGGGFRPIVFLRHGLWVGFFLLSAALAAFALRRDPDRRVLGILAGIWLMMVLALSRNVGAMLLAAAFVPIVLLTGPWVQARIAMIVAIAFLAFPVLRQADIIPVRDIADRVAQYSAVRAQSFIYRLDNEDLLLARAAEKPLAGWGGWARDRVYDETGRDLTTLDGGWIIRLGQRGWLGYLGFFGLLTAPLLLLARAMRRKPVPVATAGLATITAANLIYLVPNSALSPIGWLMAGALAGFVQYDRAEARAEEPADTGGRKRLAHTRAPKVEEPRTQGGQRGTEGPVYTRFPEGTVPEERGSRQSQRVRSRPYSRSSRRTPGS